MEKRARKLKELPNEQNIKFNDSEKKMTSGVYSLPPRYILVYDRNIETRLNCGWKWKYGIETVSIIKKTGEVGS